MSRLQAEKVPSREKAGRGSEFADRSLENTGRSKALEVIELSRVPDSSAMGATSPRRWKMAMGLGPVAEGRSDV